MSRIGAVVVTYNSEDVIGACVDSLLAAGATVVVIDNASSDRTCEVVRTRATANLIVNRENAGFAAGVNQGFTALDTPCVLLFNPDATLRCGLTELEQACARPGAGGATGKLHGPDGSLQSRFHIRRLPTASALIFEALAINRLWPGNPVNRRYRCHDLDTEHSSLVEQPSGAFWMLRRELWEKLGGFDESFHPLWFEDVDFAKRLKMAGYLTVYLPVAAASHQGGHSLKDVPQRCHKVWWYASLLRYAAKHFSRWQVWLICLSVILGSAGRTVTGIIAGRNLELIQIHGRVIRLALICMGSGHIRGTGKLL